MKMLLFANLSGKSSSIISISVVIDNVGVVGVDKVDDVVKLIGFSNLSATIPPASRKIK